MSTLTILETVREEQRSIAKRCEEIDKYTKALEDERKAYVDRADSLQTLLELYENTTRSIEESKATRARIDTKELDTNEFESMTTPRLATM